MKKYVRQFTAKVEPKENYSNRNCSFPLEVVLIQDPKDKGYTAYFKQITNLVTEGDTEKEAIDNLFYLLSKIANIDDTEFKLAMREE